MNQGQIFPKIVKVTDLRYRWTRIAKELEKSGFPILVMEHSTPKAVIFSFSQAKKLLQEKETISPKNDPLMDWRAKYAHKFSGWNATRVIRKSRNTRWKSS